MNESWIVEPFNLPYLLLFAIPLLIFILLHIAARKMSTEKRSRAISILMLITIAGFVSYKYALGHDTEYSIILFNKGLQPFNWWNELPIQLCNINMLMIPIGLALNNRKLQGFSVYSGTLGALMALLMPSAGFSGYSIFIPRIPGFYLTHWMIFFASLSMLTLGIYKPRLKDIPMLLATFYAINIAIFGINMLLRCTGLSLSANYWFNVVTEGNPLLELFHSIIPIPLLYTLPALILLAVYMLLVTGISNLICKQRA